MKSFLFSLLLLSVAAVSIGQIGFETGYFIDNDNHRTECLIKNTDWKNNPLDFIYKLTDSGVLEKGDIASVKEFGVYGFSGYIRANVDIDRSSLDINSLTYEKNPVWSHEKLFLKVLCEGKANLYQYTDGNMSRYFYSVSDTAIKQLVYKRYLVDHKLIRDGYAGGDNVAENNGFRQQLWIEARCENTTMQSFERIKYTQNDLEKYFAIYNQGFGDTTNEIAHKSTRDRFNLKIATGLNLSSISLSNDLLNDEDLTFKTDLSILFGIESEFILPFNKNKWGIIVEPTYQYFKAEADYYDNKAAIKFNSIEFPVGLRYYFFLDSELKVFLNAFYVSTISMNFDSEIDPGNNTKLQINPRNSIAFGGGIEIKGLSLELRYMNRSLITDYVFWTSNSSRFSFILGYKLFNFKR